ncbi:MAG TPA: histidinol dehydrogenase [Anaerolineae bacterium]|nr:histidinol dehydrogenase [Anaerolineae bacterium]
MTLRIYDDWEQARRTVLRRRSMTAPEEVPEPVRAGIRRIFGEELTPEQAVARILADVRQRGDDAIRDWTARIDGLALDDFEVQAEALEAAHRALPADLAAALELSAARIRDFHARQPIPSWTTTEMGGTLGQRVIPVHQVGVYTPGGTAPLPSSLLMAVIPARVAGVDEVVVCTPPGREGDRVPDVILAAAHVAGVDRLFRLGGAQAIGALAYGTATVPRVDKIVGAGGLFTTLAKRQVYGQVGLDGLYGPTETVVVADDSANPAWVAADLLAQAEHDVLATAILLTPSRPLAQAVQAEVARRMEDLSRADVIATSLADQGGIVLTPDLETAVRLADEFAPEHLCLSVQEPERWASSIRNAGGLFLGEHSFEVLGDYVAGPSHIMPTGGTAKWASPLNVLDFCKIVNVIALDAETAARIGPAAARIANAESLTAHAAAASARSGADDARGADDTDSPGEIYTMKTEPSIYCGEEAIANLIRYCQSHQYSRFLLVSDQNTHAALGQRVETTLRRREWDVRTVVLNREEVIADEKRIVEVLVQANAEERTYLAVGSGTITDITRYASYCARNIFISLPTAPSVDAYTSAGAALVTRGFKNTILCQAPVAVFADLQTLCEAPREMIAAGFGDVLGKYTSLADWQLGHLLIDEPYSPEIAQRIRRALLKCVEHAEKIGQASREGITTLMEGLFESGSCMAEFGSSRPASGAEHLLSHFWEMKRLQAHHPAILHGTKVGVGTVLAARRYEAIRGLSRKDAIDRLSTASLPDRGDEIACIRTAYGAVADRIIADHQPFLEMLEANSGTLEQRIADRWTEIQEIAARVPPAQRIADLLDQVGGPSHPRAVGLSEDEVRLALEFSRYLRRRFTVNTLGRTLGLW